MDNQGSEGNIWRQAAVLARINGRAIIAILIVTDFYISTQEAIAIAIRHAKIFREEASAGRIIVRASFSQVCHNDVAD